MVAYTMVPGGRAVRGYPRDALYMIGGMPHEGALLKLLCSKISVVRVSADTLTSLGDVPVAAPVKGIVVDPKSHTVWTAYPKDKQSFVQSLSAAPPAGKPASN